MYPTMTVIVWPKLNSIFTNDWVCSRENNINKYVIIFIIEQLLMFVVTCDMNGEIWKTAYEVISN